MPARKSTLAEPARSGVAKPARLSERPALLRGRKTVSRGNSETRFTRAELEQLLSVPTHDLGAEQRGVRSELIDAAWEHGRVTPEADASIWRQDACGAWMRREQVGRQAEFGWKIRSVSTSAEQTADDLRPFHWSNDFDIASGEPRCGITADRSGVPGEEQVRPPRNRES